MTLPWLAGALTEVALSGQAVSFPDLTAACNRTHGAAQAIYSLLLLLIFLRRERKKKHQLLFHLFMHALVASCMCPDGRLNPHPGVLGRCPRSVQPAACEL